MNQPYDETSDISNFQELEARVRRPELDDDPQNREDEETEIQVAAIYDSADYEHLRVSVEVKELFQSISRYNTQTIELDHKLKPFIPDFIPAVGDIDAFLKVWILSLCSGEIFMYVSCVSLYW
ncbi:intraflagellar transport protein 46 homolog isoform X4 [Limulus polyphemus]|uniref:Intraflagellar transport protein 46 homolog n=1 Tax=Limulus polyphemus TaxID=6850 RepID=A0ABM1RYF6_LIMPO|nr:intraflagellar transport protein 46 homolog isoform X4 [Limulus polyphemus]